MFKNLKDVNGEILENKNGKVKICYKQRHYSFGGCENVVGTYKTYENKKGVYVNLPLWGENITTEKTRIYL